MRVVPLGFPDLSLQEPWHLGAFCHSRAQQIRASPPPNAKTITPSCRNGFFSSGCLLLCWRVAMRLLSPCWKCQIPSNISLNCSFRRLLNRNFTARWPKARGTLGCETFRKATAELCLVFARARQKNIHFLRSARPKSNDGGKGSVFIACVTSSNERKSA